MNKLNQAIEEVLAGIIQNPTDTLWCVAAGVVIGWGLAYIR